MLKIDEKLEDGEGDADEENQYKDDGVGLSYCDDSSHYAGQDSRPLSHPIDVIFFIIRVLCAVVQYAKEQTQGS